jgi:hypothetical protein
MKCKKLPLNYFIFDVGGNRILYLSKALLYARRVLCPSGKRKEKYW